MLWSKQVFALIAAVFILALSLSTPNAKAWGDEGHEIVGLIAYHFLNPAAKAKVDSMLAADTDALTAHDIASEATWADKYRDSDRSTTKERYNQTNKWHFVDIELGKPDLDTACFNHPPLPAGTPAIQGAPADCVVDKIDEFAAELSAPRTSPEERLDALKFVLHFVGDVHQPLHSSDNNDAGGNEIKVSAAGFKSGNLHHFWDTEFVARLNSDQTALATSLISKITKAEITTWSKGTASDWAKEAFAEAKSHAYGRLGTPTAPKTYQLTPAYGTDAATVVSLQLRRAGVRLAMVLNKALGGS